MPKGVKGFQKGNKFGYLSKPPDYSGEKNPHYGKHHTKEARERIRQARLTMPLTGKSYSSIHSHIKRLLPKPELCVACKKRPPDDLSNTGHTYKYILSDWEWLCHSCHMWKDGRQFNLKQYANQKPI